MPIPLIAWGFLALGGLGGGVAGALARQPEINRLKEQIKQLQGEAQRLNQLIDKQNRQIESLRMKYQSMQAMHGLERAKAAGNLKGAIMYSYCMKEYLDLEQRYLQPEAALTDEEAQFRQCFAAELAGTVPNDNSRKILRYFLRQFIRRKYAAQIDGLIECDLSQTMRRIGELVC